MAKNYHIIMKIEILSWIKEILDRGSIEELYTNRDKLASLGLVSKMLETVSSRWSWRLYARPLLPGKTNGFETFDFGQQEEKRLGRKASRKDKVKVSIVDKGEHWRSNI